MSGVDLHTDAAPRLTAALVERRTGCQPSWHAAAPPYDVESVLLACDGRWPATSAAVATTRPLRLAALLAAAALASALLAGAGVLSGGWRPWAAPAASPVGAEGIPAQRLLEEEPLTEGQQLAGFLEEVRQRRRPRDPGSEEEDAKADLAQFLADIERQHGVLRIEHEARQKRTLFDFFNDMERKQNELRDQGEKEDPEVVRQKMEDFIDKAVEKKINGTEDAKVGTQSGNVMDAALEGQTVPATSSSPPPASASTPSPTSTSTPSPVSTNSPALTSTSILAPLTTSTLALTTTGSRAQMTARTSAPASASTKAPMTTTPAPATIAGAPAPAITGLRAPLRQEPANVGAEGTTEVAVQAAPLEERPAGCAVLGCSREVRLLAEGSCSCSASCKRQGICCEDYSEVCEREEEADVRAQPRFSWRQHDGSCEVYGCVSFMPAQACQCNKECKKFQDCCWDYVETCATVLEVSHSCAIYGCSDQFVPSRRCQCNEHCEHFRDCCFDYAEECTIEFK